MTRWSVRVVLFDLDGVLVDSTASVAEAWTAWALRHGIDADAVIHQAHGRRAVDTIRSVAPHLDPDAETALLEGAEIAAAESTRALPGAARHLHALPPGTWAVVTSGTRKLARARITATGLPEPSVLVTAEDVTAGKPDPASYLRAASLLGVDAADALVVEDTPAGIAAAVAAGMPAIGLTTTYPAGDLAAASAVVATADDLAITLADDGELAVTTRDDVQGAEGTDRTRPGV